MMRTLSVFLLLFIFSFCSKPREYPTSVNGVLDLRKFTFSDSESSSAQSIPLNGEWEFFWKEHIDPNRSRDILTNNFINVPKPWNQQKFSDRDGSSLELTGQGFATYRLKILLNTDRDLSLRFKTISNAYKVYADGVLIGSVGKATDNIDTYLPAYRPQVLDLPKRSGESLDLLIHVSNFVHRKGGIWDPIYIGEKTRIHESRMNSLAIDLFLSGSLLMMGLYHIGIFTRRKKEKFMLYFGIFCILMSLRSILTEEFYFYQLLPNFSFLWGLRLAYLSLNLVIVFYLYYISDLFSIGKLFGVKYIFLGITLLISTIILITPPKIFTFTIFPIYLISLSVILFSIYILFDSYRTNKENVRLFILGFFLVFGFTFNDILYDLKIIHTGNLTHVGIFLFTFFQSFYLSTKISNAFNELEFLSANLEIQVKERTREVEAANQAKSDFLSSMSHEIRTPMNAILGFSEIISNSIKGGEFKTYIDAIMSSGKTLLNLINDILDLSKIESGEMNLHSDRINLRLISKEVENIFFLKFREKGLSFHIEVEETFPELLLMDEVRIKQIFINLIGNSIKFTQKGGITLRLKSEQSIEMSNLRIEIEDTGIGIPKADQPGIFDPFRQTKNQSTKLFGGTGLGLTITKKLIEIMGGKIHLESEVGKGTKFTIQFYDVRLAEPLENEVNLPLETVSFVPSKVLVVDDLPLNRKLIQTHLTRRGITILEAENGRDAIEVAVKHKPDLVFMNISMPVMDGHTSIAEIRKIEEIARTPIVALTAFAFKQDEEKIRKSGFDDYVIKPVLLNDLVRVTKKFIKTSNHESGHLEPVLHPSSSGTNESFETGSLMEENPFVILVVDDVPENRILIKSFLKGMKNLKIVEGENGQEAIQLFKSHNPDLILTDLQMPIMDGYSAIQIIRGIEEKGKKVPIYVVTSSVSRDEEEIERYDFTDFLLKPINKKEFLEIIGYHINGN